MGQRPSRPSIISPRPFRQPNPNYDIPNNMKPLPERINWIEKGFKPFHCDEKDGRGTTPPTPHCFSPAQRDIHLSTTFTYLTISDLCALSAVSVFFHTETTSDRVWLRWLRRDFPALRSIREPSVTCDDDVLNDMVKENEQQQVITKKDDNKTDDNKDDKKDVLSDTDEKALLQAIRSGDVATATRLASEAAQRGAIATTGKEPFIAPVDPLLNIFHTELSSLPEHERVICTSWDGTYGMMKSNKQHYEDELRRHYDPCLTSPQALAEYLLARQELIDGLTSMCRQPHVGSAMEIKTRGLRKTWPNVHLSCKLHFDYLRSFYWSWHGIRKFNPRLDHDRLRAIEHLHEYEPVVTSTGDIELQLTISIPGFSSDRERAASIAHGLATYREILNMSSLVDLLGGKQALKVVQVIQLPYVKRWGTLTSAIPSTSST